MEQRGFNNQVALYGVKRVGHYAIPATTGALGGGVAGSALGSYAGDKINQKIEIGLHPCQGRNPKGA